METRKWDPMQVQLSPLLLSETEVRCCGERERGRVEGVEEHCDESVRWRSSCVCCLVFSVFLFVFICYSNLPIYSLLIYVDFVSKEEK